MMPAMPPDLLGLHLAGRGACSERGCEASAAYRHPVGTPRGVVTRYYCVGHGAPWMKRLHSTGDVEEFDKRPKTSALHLLFTILRDRVSTYQIAALDSAGVHDRQGYHEDLVLFSENATVQVGLDEHQNDTHLHLPEAFRDDDLAQKWDRKSGGLPIRVIHINLDEMEIGRHFSHQYRLYCAAAAIVEALETKSLPSDRRYSDGTIRSTRYMFYGVPALNVNAGFMTEFAGTQWAKQGSNADNLQAMEDHARRTPALADTAGFFRWLRLRVSDTGGATAQQFQQLIPDWVVRDVHNNAEAQASLRYEPFPPRGPPAA
ncbi:unnamed protein product [Pedinophyceae sp. YPF-701]|nr:unnamed protein product [Pedinophyceae sp. YPF-701]